MESMQVLGFIAGIITSGAMMPQLIKTWKTKQVEQLSIKMFLAYIVGFSTWIVYGIEKSDVPIIATNIFSILQTICMIVLRLKYNKK